MAWNLEQWAEVQCDACGDYVSRGVPLFEEAMAQWCEENGWTRIPDNVGGWDYYCPECKAKIEGRNMTDVSDADRAAAWKAVCPTDGRTPIQSVAEALIQARAEGYRAGVEAAAKAFRDCLQSAIVVIGEEIRALAETGEG